MGNTLTPTCTHWGNYRIESDGRRILGVHPYTTDSDPTPIGQSLLDALDPGTRIPQPMVRQSYLLSPEASATHLRGREPFVAVSWEQALDLAAQALQRARQNHGNSAIYGGSYGWGSAGRFHHAQSQIHRFLNGFGGYTRSVNTYSTAAAEVIVPHVLGIPFMQLVYEAPTAEDIAAHCKTLLLFGGAAMKNNQVNAGGIGSHTARAQLEKIRDAGVEIINVSPIRDDTGDFLDARWLPIRPGTDVALMLGMMHTLFSEGLHDQAFLDQYTVGFQQFSSYLMGHFDGQEKDVAWAESLTGIDAQTITGLARQLHRQRSVVGISWSLQRQEHGEQPYWAITALAAMLGDIGLPGGGVAYGYGCIHNMGFSGRRVPNYRLGSLPQGRNLVPDFIPVSRIAEMLESPGESFNYDGQQLNYPEIQLIYWAGGNPFHHHQDLNRLRAAWAEPETVIVNEAFWTATARHADILFPVTTVLERDDFGGGSSDAYLSPMPQAVAPFQQSRDDYQVFTALSERLGFADSFTEGKSGRDWVEQLYNTTRDNAATAGVSLPGFADFWAGEQFSVLDQLPDAEYALEQFRRDPDVNRLATPSGKIELFSQTVADFGYPDCAGYPRWFDKSESLSSERASDYPLHLVSNQPRTRLHSQYDHGITSRQAKVNGREPVRIHPVDAAQRNINEGDLVRLHNKRGACLAGAVICDGLRQGVIELATGAWYCPDENGLDLHGNPNVLTRDVGTSSLAQGPTAHSCLVEMELYERPAAQVTAFEQPAFANMTND